MLRRECPASQGVAPALVVATGAAERAHGADRSRPPQLREGGVSAGGVRPGVLEEPGAQWMDAALSHRAAGEASVASPVLAAPAAEEIDHSSLALLVKLSLDAKKEEEKRKVEEEERWKVDDERRVVHEAFAIPCPRQGNE